jgi:hypothetical protein
LELPHAESIDAMSASAAARMAMFQLRGLDIPQPSRPLRILGQYRHARSNAAL